MLEHCRFIVGVHVWEGVGTTVAAQQQRVAGAVVACVVGIGSSPDKSTIRILAVSRRDTFRYDSAAGVLADMYHLRARISLLPMIGDGHGIELGHGVVATQHA